MRETSDNARTSFKLYFNFYIHMNIYIADGEDIILLLSGTGRSAKSNIFIATDLANIYIVWMVDYVEVVKRNK